MADEDVRARAPRMMRRGGDRPPEQRMLRPSMARRVSVQDERTASAYVHDEPTGESEIVPRVRSTGETRPEEPRRTMPMMSRPVLQTNIYSLPDIAYTRAERGDFVSRFYGHTVRPPNDDDATAT